jgi:hypothetical protein
MQFRLPISASSSRNMSRFPMPYSRKHRQRGLRHLLGVRGQSERVAEFLAFPNVAVKGYRARCRCSEERLGSEALNCSLDSAAFSIEGECQVRKLAIPLNLHHYWLA